MAGPVRHSIDTKSLERYLNGVAPEIKTPLDVKQFGYGQSNPTYLLRDRTGHQYVMRKKPPGKLLSSTAHRVDREYRILHALEDTDVPVPKTYCLCEDDAVIGTSFYIMEFLDGRIFGDPSLPGVSPGTRTEMWHDAILTLAKLHRITPSSVNLSSFGKHSGFYSRQVHLFKRLCEAQANTRDVDTKELVGKVPHFDEMTKFFEKRELQPRDRGTFIHGDYKIDNIIFHQTEPRVIGLLDWEMSTIGHPLADLTNILSPYVASNHQVAEKLQGPSAAAAKQSFISGITPGLPSREQCLAWYSETADWDPRYGAELEWGDAFSMFKYSVIMQGIAARHAVRQASSERAKDVADMMQPYGTAAWSLVEDALEKLKRTKARL